VARVRSDEIAEVAARGMRHAGPELLGAKCDDQGREDQPDPTSPAPSTGSAWGAEPERVAYHRPASVRCSRATRTRTSTELPDQARGKGDDQGAARTARPAQLIGDERCDHLGE
jgi:hypothetical protein